MTCNKCRNPYCKCVCDTRTVDAFPAPNAETVQSVKTSFGQTKRRAIIQPLAHPIRGTERPRK